MAPRFSEAKHDLEELAKSIDHCLKKIEPYNLLNQLDLIAEAFDLNSSQLRLIENSAIRINSQLKTLSKRLKDLLESVYQQTKEKDI